VVNSEKEKEKLSILKKQQEAKLFELVMNEIANDRRHKGLWGQAIVMSNGDKKKIEIEYIKLRVESLKDEKTVSKLNKEIKEEEKRLAKKIQDEKIQSKIFIKKLEEDKIKKQIYEKERLIKEKDKEKRYQEQEKIQQQTLLEQQKNDGKIGLIFVIMSIIFSFIVLRYLLF
jgi:hypothetical protein